jgi:hypothetical protein
MTELVSAIVDNHMFYLVYGVVLGAYLFRKD